MTTTVGAAQILVRPSFKGFNQSVNQQLGPVGESGGQSFGGGFTRGFKKVLATAGGIFAGVKITQFFGDATWAASDLAETVSKSNNIFHENAGIIRDWARNASKEFGLSQSAALEYAASFGNMFQQLGFAGDEAVKMSQNVVKLSTDLGSFNNMPTADVADRIAAAFRGEYDSLQKLIPNINAARVEKEALAMTGKENAKQLTAQEKAAAVLAIVSKDGAAALDDFAETSDGLANSSKITKAQFEDLQATIGNALIPFAEKGMTAFQGFFNGLNGDVERMDQSDRPKLELLGLGIRGLGDAFTNGDVTSDGFIGAMETVGVIARDVFDYIQNTAIPALEDFGGWIVQNKEWLIPLTAGVLGFWGGVKLVTTATTIWTGVTKAYHAAQLLLNGALKANPIGLVVGLIAGLVAAFITAYNTSDTFREKVDGAFQKVKDVIGSVSSWFSDTVVPGWKNAIGAIGDAWDGLRAAFAKPINWVLDNVWNKGIVAVFNKAAEAVGSSRRLGMASLLNWGESQPGGSSGRMMARRRGGFTPPGWTLVGEEGPELVQFRDPNRVYTAAQTAAALAAGRDLDDRLARRAAGRHPGEALAPMGGNIVDTVVGWVRGGLASAASKLLDPIVRLINGAVGGSVFGGMIGDTAKAAVRSLVDWIRGHDNTAPPIGGAGWVRPSRGPITSRYGPRWGGTHAGIDVAGGGPTYAAGPGRVFRTGSGILGGRTGLGIGIDHGGGVFTYYGHNPVGGIRVKPGQLVKRGQHIGYQGATGNVTGVHLHFELHQGGWGRAVNPERLGVFDQGGRLLPGGTAVNLSRRPEVVFTDSQWATLHRLAARGTQTPDTVVIVDADGALIGRMRVESRQVLSDQVADARQQLLQRNGVR